MVVRGSACDAASCTSRSGTPASNLAVSGDECVPQRVGPDGLGNPGAAGDRADDPPGAVPVQPAPAGGEEVGPSARSPVARSIARAVRGVSGMVTTVPPLRVITRVRCPRPLHPVLPGAGRGAAGWHERVRLPPQLPARHDDEPDPVPKADGCGSFTVTGSIKR